MALGAFTRQLSEMPPGGERSVHLRHQGLSGGFPLPPPGGEGRGRQGPRHRLCPVRHRGLTAKADFPAPAPSPSPALEAFPWCYLPALLFEATFQKNACLSGSSFVTAGPGNPSYAGCCPCGCAVSPSVSPPPRGRPQAPVTQGSLRDPPKNPQTQLFFFILFPGAKTHRVLRVCSCGSCVICIYT